MSERDSDFRIKPGRIRSTRAPRTKSYVNQVLAAALDHAHRLTPADLKPIVDQAQAEAARKALLALAPGPAHTKKFCL